jgi:ABC-2 type transport system ATP-binding protein
LHARSGEIHALLGPNGAGKTTLLRILAGLTAPTSGRVCVLGADVSGGSRALRQSVGLVPSGDRSFYLRISGLENLVFFARLHGLRRLRATARARDVLELVGLGDAARVRVGEYSHGMQKRLSVARALLTSPAVLLVDEATHDLDPEGARVVRGLVRGIAERGACVVWATQRVDEIKGFADEVTLLRSGEVCFNGTVAELLAHAAPRRYVLRLELDGRPADDLARSLAPAGVIEAVSSGGPGHYVLSLAEGAVLGEAIARLTAADVAVLSCTEEQSGVEQAFLHLTAEPS